MQFWISTIGSRIVQVAKRRDETREEKKKGREQRIRKK